MRPVIDDKRIPETPFPIIPLEPEPDVVVSPDGTKSSAIIFPDKVEIRIEEHEPIVAKPIRPRDESESLLLNDDGEPIVDEYVKGRNVPLDFPGYFPSNFDEEAKKRYLEFWINSPYSSTKHSSIVEYVRKERRMAGNPLSELPKGRQKKQLD